MQGNQENTGSQGALVAVLAAVRESSAKQAEGLTRLEERLKTLETKQEASCEKLTKKIRKEKPYSFKRKGHEVLSRKFWSGGKIGRGTKISGILVRADHFFLKILAPPVKISVRPA